jgi:hypothetical protein
VPKSGHLIPAAPAVRVLYVFAPPIPSPVTFC